MERLDSKFSAYFSKLGKKGGKNRMASMTPEMLHEFVMKGVAKRKQNRLDKNKAVLYTKDTKEKRRTK